MNKEEHIKKIDEILSDSLYYKLDDGGRPYYEFDKSEAAENLISEGYVNARDFISYLEKQFTFLFVSSDKKGTKLLLIDLEKELQNYLSGGK